MPEQEGKFIVLYGANNLGKSKQIKLLRERLEEFGIQIIQIKYPVYDLEPTGPILNAVLRHGRKMPELEVQRLFAQNRLDFEPQLRAILASGRWAVSEDYTGTGIAWGLARGLSLEELEAMNQGLLAEDLAILLYGERFKDGIEETHRNEQDDAVWHLAQQHHLFLGERYGWEKTYASRSKLAVHMDIMDIVLRKLMSIRALNKERSLKL